MDPNINQPQQPAQPEVPPTPPNSLHLIKTLLISLLGILVLSTIAGGIYLLANNQKTPEQIATVATPTPLSSKASATEDDPTADWQTYKIETIDMELKLPAKFNKYGEFQEIVYNNPEFGGKVLCMSFPPLEFKTGWCSFRILQLSATSTDFGWPREAAFPDLGGFSLKGEKYFTRFGNWEIPNSDIERVDNGNGVEILRIKRNVKFIPASEVFPVPRPPIYYPGRNVVGALVNTRNEMFPGFTLAMDLENTNLTENDFNQILSTFRFINSESNNSGSIACIQVITPARNNSTNECREFPTPCDVPSGWTKVSNCSN